MSVRFLTPKPGLWARQKISVIGKVKNKNWYQVSLGLDREGYVYAPLLKGGDVVATRPNNRRSRPPRPEPAKPSIAELMRRGEAAVERKDLKEAAKFFELAAATGNAEAQFELGNIYLDTKFENWNKYRGVDLYRAAAKQGHEVAQQVLGFLLLAGMGGPNGFNEAAHWLKLTSAKGHHLSMALLAQLYVSGVRVEKNIPEARRLYRALIDAGSPEFQKNLDALEGR